MKILQELKQRFFQKKRGASSPRKTTAKGEEREIMTPACPTLVVRRRSSESDVFAKRQQECKEQLKQSLERKTFRSRDQTMSCNSYFAEHTATRPYMRDRMLTENAKHLSPEQLQALEMDIFKPLDFYEILFNRMKAKDNEMSDRGRSSWLLKITEQIDSKWLHSNWNLSIFRLIICQRLFGHSFETLHKHLFALLRADSSGRGMICQEDQENCSCMFVVANAQIEKVIDLAENKNIDQCSR